MDLARYNELEHKWFKQPLSPEEVAELWDSFEHAIDLNERLRALYLAAKSSDAKQEHRVKPLLNEGTDPALTALALKVLVDYWSLGDKYFDKLLAAIEGVEWDLNGDIRLQAVMTGAVYSRYGQKRITVAKHLLNIVESDSEEEYLRDAIVHAFGDSLDLDKGPTRIAVIDAKHDNELGQMIVSMVREKFEFLPP